MGSFVLKIPQIAKIVSAKSAEGISIIALLVECFAFLVSASYFHRQGFPLSTYGEAPVIFTQNMIVLLLIFVYSKDYSFVHGLLLIFGYCALFAVSSMTELVPMIILNKIYASSILLIFGSRLPQIITNYRAGSTGNLAFITCFQQFGGALARTFTILKEVDDLMPLIVICCSAACNGTIVLQFILYWNSDKKKKD